MATNSPWEAVRDEASGTHYYWNADTDETTWDRPVGVAIAGLPEEEEVVDAPKAEGKQADETPVDPSQRSADYYTSQEYYNSKEYYDWYYAQYAKTDDAPPGTAAEPGAAAAAGATKAGVPPLSYPFAAAWNPLTAAGLDPSDSDLQPDYTTTGSFNARTGKFTALNGPTASQFDHISKAERQMSHFFDIKQYQEERNAERQQQKGVVQKLSKKELQKFKEKSKEKKKQRLLKRLGDD
ncbi:hypothetical protein HDU98_010466 [Podochytrium sp. JEL0797]|nr:hypothetical protein HDU98_010466 [Podochytrium sp. JEL0797]